MEFIDELISLCKRHGAVVYARTDGKRPILSIEKGRIWLDFKRIDGDGAVGFTVLDYPDETPPASPGKQA